MFAGAIGPNPIINPKPSERTGETKRKGPGIEGPGKARATTGWGKEREWARTAQDREGSPKAPKGREHGRANDEAANATPRKIGHPHHPTWREAEEKTGQEPE